MQSEGSFGLHQMTAHVAGSAPPAAAPPVASHSQSPPAFGEHTGAYGDPLPPRSSNSLAVVLGAVGLAVVLIFAGSIAAVSFLGTDAKPTPVALVDPAALPVMPADFHVVTNVDEGFLIGLPASFNEVALTPDGVAAAADAIGSTNPGLASVVRSTTSQIKGARLFAVDPSTGKSETVQRLPLGAHGSIDDVPAGMFSDQYKRIGAASVNEEHVKLPAGDAVKVTVVLNQNGVDVLVVQHVLVRDSTAWILTNAQDSRGDATIATAVASTFGWTK